MRRNPLPFPSPGPPTLLVADAQFPKQRPLRSCFFEHFPALPVIRYPSLPPDPQPLRSLTLKLKNDHSACASSSTSLRFPSLKSAGPPGGTRLLKKFHVLRLLSSSSLMSGVSCRSSILFSDVWCLASDAGCWLLMFGLGPPK